MLQIQDTQLFNEIKVFFANGENGVLKVLSFIQSQSLAKYLPRKVKQSRFSNKYILSLLMLHHFLNCRSLNDLVIGPYQSLVECGKDTLYRFINSPFINWRKLLDKLNEELIDEKLYENDPYQPYNQPCFIIDDSDLPKRGKHIEFIGYIWSHLKDKSIVGFKSLNLCLWTGLQVYAIDFSLHCEEGKNKSKPQGLKPSQLKKRYNKKRNDNCHGAKRCRERKHSKIKAAIRMIQRACKRNVPARYVLADSWFCCLDLIKAVRAINQLDLLCMAKFGKTLYDWNGQQYTLKEMLNKCKSSKKMVKRNRSLKIKYFSIPVMIKGIPVKLFFYKCKKKWKVLLSTDKGIGPIQAFKIYQNRWSIEVFYKEAKQHCGLGKCQSRDFDAQIASATLSLMAYNVLSKMKDKRDYTVGALFAQTQDVFIKPNIMQRFWKVITQLLESVTKLFKISYFELIDQLKANTELFDIDTNPFIAYLLNYKTCET